MAVKKLLINKIKCIQCGTCVAAFPELFEFEENGVSVRVKPGADFSGKDLEEIKNICPNGAIEEVDDPE